MNSTFDVIWKDYAPYINIDEFIQHLANAKDTVDAFCGSTAPESTSIVCDTLQVTIDTLVSAIGRSPYDR